MVKSLINSDIEYSENRGLYEDDKFYEAALYEIRMYDYNLNIAIGKPKNLYQKMGVIFYPIYVVKKDIVKKQIGVYEILNEDIQSTLDEEGDLNLIKLEPLLYNFIITNPKQLSELKQDENNMDDEDVEETQKEKRPVIKKSKTIRLWINKLTEDLNYDVEVSESNGDCFFISLQNAFKTVGEVKSVSEMREMLANEVNDELFQEYTKMFNDAKIEYQQKAAEAKKLTERFKLLKNNSKLERDRSSLKNQSTEAREIKIRHDEMLETLYHTKNLLDEFKYMENINSVKEFQDFIKTKEFWADTWTISTLERILNIKTIILSLESYRSKDLDNILECGQLNDNVISNQGVFQPNFYIMLEYNGDHYNLITYDSKGALSFNEIPEYIKTLIINKCLETNAGLYYLIPEFKQLKETEVNKKEKEENEEETIIPNVSKESKIQKDLSETMNYGHLYNENTVFVFYKGSDSKIAPGKNTKAGEKLDVDDIKKFGELRGIKDWRKMLDDTWMHKTESEEIKPLFSLDSMKWASVDHYVKGARYRSNPDVFSMFSLDNPRDLGKNLEILQSVSKTGKYKKEVVIPKQVKPDDNWKDNESENLKKAHLAKFSDKNNKALKNALLQTQNAKLVKHIHRGEPRVANELMQVRKILSE